MDSPKFQYENHMVSIDGFHWPRKLPSGYVKIAIETGHRNSGFTHEKWWFSIVFCMFTRGYSILPNHLNYSATRDIYRFYILLRIGILVAGWWFQWLSHVKSWGKNFIPTICWSNPSVPSTKDHPMEGKLPSGKHTKNYFHNGVLMG